MKNMCVVYVTLRMCETMLLIIQTLLQMKNKAFYAPSYPTTEPDVDLKLITRSPGRMDVGQYKSGMLTRDGEEHYLFVENDMQKKQTTAEQRNPHVYEGRCINVNQKLDGTLYPTFNRPPYTQAFAFKHFCLAAAEELLLVAGRIG